MPAILSQDLVVSPHLFFAGSPKMVSQSEILARLKLVDAYRRTGSYTRAARLENTDYRRVQRWVKRWEATGSVADKPRSGRPRKELDSVEATAIIDEGSIQEKCAPQITKDLLKNIASLGNALNPDTLRRHMKRTEFQNLVKKKKLSLSERHTADRLRHCKTWIRKPWSNVVVTDSKYFWLCPKGRGRKVWVKKGRSPPTGKTDRSCFKVHVYGGVTKYKPSHKGRTPLLVTAGTSNLGGRKAVNAAIYLELLQQKLIPACKKMMEQEWGPSGWVFQQDNARPHTAKITQDWLASQQFQLMKWPAKSPDLSWIESIWAWMADALNRRTDLTEANFQAAVMETWDSIPRSVMEAQFSSIRGKGDGKGRLPECIAAGGDVTRF